MNGKKKAQTLAARETREAQRGYTYEWLKALFESGLRQKQWAGRKEAAAWLTVQSEDSAWLCGGPVLCESNEMNRPYSRDLYRKLSKWEAELSLSYRTKGDPKPIPDPEAEFTVFDPTRLPVPKQT